MNEPAIKIAVLKPRATFGHGEAKKLIAKHQLHAEIIFCGSNLEVCNTLAEGNADLAVVPLENNIAGLVPDWIAWCNAEARLHGERRAEIVHEIVADVGQCLLVKPGVRESDIKKILSHERALKQCTALIEALGVPLSETNSTAAAAELVAASSVKDGLAAIAAEAAAYEYGLEILRQNTEDQPGNVTRFGILKSKVTAAAIPDLTKNTGRRRYIVRFGLPNAVGALHGVTEVLLRHGANMTSLRDLPQGLARRYVYSFYVEYEIVESLADSCLQALKEVTENLIIFGNFFVEEK